MRLEKYQFANFDIPPGMQADHTYVPFKRHEDLIETPAVQPPVISDEDVAQARSAGYEEGHAAGYAEAAIAVKAETDARLQEKTLATIRLAEALSSYQATIHAAGIARSALLPDLVLAVARRAAGAGSSRERPRPAAR